MKVFFMTSPRGDIGLAHHIYTIIQDLGHIHTSDFVITIDPSSFYSADEKTWEHRYQERMNQIDEADICIFEASIPSLAIGQLFQEAVREEKPTIALHMPGKQPYTFMSTEGNENRVQVIEYKKDNLKELLKYAISEAEELLNTRFTMILPNHMIRFLDRINKKTGISRSEFIRNLIQREMRAK